MKTPGTDARHIDATERLNLRWEHLGLRAAVPKQAVFSRTEGKDAA
jgi:hypothetical protein